MGCDNIPSEIRFNLLQGVHTLAFKMAAADGGKQWFRHKTILNAQRFTHGRRQIFLSFCGHDSGLNISLNMRMVNSAAFADQSWAGTAPGMNLVAGR